MDHVFLLSIHVCGILAKIVAFVMVMVLTAADGEIWIPRRRAIVPTLRMKVVDVDNVKQRVTMKLILMLDLQALANKLGFAYSR